MNIGPLNKRGRVEYKVAAQDPVYGTPLVIWTTLRELWLGLQDELPSRSEAVKQGLTVAARRTRIRSNYHADIDSSMRIVVLGAVPVTYQIVAGPADYVQKTVTAQLGETVFGDGSVLLALEDGKATLPSVVFFNFEERRPVYGRLALHEYLENYEGRLMRSLKSLLGSSLLLETTVINHRAVSFLDIVATFLGVLRERASQTLGAAPRRVVMGRPVHFVDDDPERDALAQQSLLQAARSVGFDEVSFQLEPIAAALRAGAQIVVAGRVADPSLALGPALAHYGWRADDWDAIAGATMAGHLLECGAQVTGGYFSDPGFKDVPEPWNFAFPIAEVDADGNAVITKVAGTGGALSSSASSSSSVSSSAPSSWSQREFSRTSSNRDV